MKKTGLQLLSVLLILSAGAAMGWFAKPKCAEIVEIRIDTLVKIDTLRDTVRVPVERYIARVDTVWLQSARDTVRVEVEVPIERKVYQTDEYRAEIEGFRPSLVSMEVYRQTQYITTVQTVIPKIRPWRMSVSAGYRMTFIDKNTNFAPFANININYTPKRITYGLSAGYVATFRQDNMTTIPFMGLNINYPLFQLGKQKR